MVDPVTGNQDAFLADTVAQGTSPSTTTGPTLPNTGAPASATWLLPLGLGFLLSGCLLMLACIRPRPRKL